MSRYLEAFTTDEFARVLRLLKDQVRLLRLVKGHYEEYHWSAIYRTAKGLAPGGWSNLPFRDFTHDGRGVEWKTLGSADPVAHLGKRLMHPAASRRIRFNPEGSAEEAKVAVLSQWGNDIAEFEARVAATTPRGRSDIRWGILLWSTSLTDFVYWEERLERPDPVAYYAEWAKVRTRSSESTNLYIFDRKTKEKMFSVTAPRAGSKLQPYFRVPTRAEGAYVFDVGRGSHVPLWITPETLKRLGLAEDDEGERRLSDLLDEYDKAKQRKK